MFGQREALNRGKQNLYWRSSADTHEGDAKRQKEEIKMLIGHACNHTSQQILDFLARQYSKIMYFLNRAFSFLDLTENIVT